MDSLKELVKIAKGADRTIKDYAKASGVDAAVISKIMAGKYVPKKTKVYEALTTTAAAPRGGVTAAQLIKAAKSSKSYEEGRIDGLKTLSKVLGAIGNVPVSSLSKNPYVAGASLLALTGEFATEALISKRSKASEKEDKSLNEVHRFSAIANGIIYGRLGQMGVSFIPSSKEELGISENSIDSYIKIQNPDVEEYVLRYLFLNESDCKTDFIMETATRRIIEELIFLKPNPKRKISIVTNCKEGFETLMKYEEKLSYRGNLSAVLIDIESIKLADEKYLSLYDYESQKNMLNLV